MREIGGRGFDMHKRRKEFLDLIKKTGLTSTKLAKLTGTPYSTWHNWELGYSRSAPIAIAFLKLYIMCQEEKRYMINDYMPNIIIIK